MTDEQYLLNEKIALLRGFKQDLDGPDTWTPPDGYLWFNLPGLPAWSEDLNLMLEEKKKLDWQQRDLFELALAFVMGRDSLNSKDLAEPVVHMSSATQQAEALVMTLEGTSSHES